MGSTNQDEDDVIIGSASTSILAAGVAIIVAYEHESSISREPYVNKDQEREFYMNSILNGSAVHCIGQIRMSTTQNALAVINFNLKFTYVLAGWEGSTHDSRILKDALERPHGLQIPQVNHGEKGERQFRWSKSMEYLMLEILANEVKQGNKSTNQFKANSFKRVSNAINELGMDCSSKHVENHLKTIRNTWSTIQTLLNKSGLGWDDNLKMITVSPEVYAVHIQNILLVGYLSKLLLFTLFRHISIMTSSSTKILKCLTKCLVCGNDRDKGDTSFEDIDFDSFSKKDNDNDLEGPSIEKDVQVTETSQIKASRKRKRSFEGQDVVGDISIKFGEVATVIGRMIDSRPDVTKLYQEVMAMEGYNKEFLGDAFDYLVQSNTLAKAFMVKNQNLHKVWLEQFKQQQ
ncbi:hypothetical protein CQW23_16355 [Capsicum baccatum]|uniref:Myb/SANT-like domain-containing protein n=1 Tax=Capsicum baccatum TaxID=33114 RepID=A0A2G2WB57_CAPBA|nr:hypothetical protein CQW23_16355 [Capsicum baccatum]